MMMWFESDRVAAESVQRHPHIYQAVSSSLERAAHRDIYNQLASTHRDKRQQTSATAQSIRL